MQKINKKNVIVDETTFTCERECDDRIGRRRVDGGIK